MAYWFLEKESDRAVIYGTMVAISQAEWWYGVVAG